MKLWRITRARYLSESWSGAGGLHAPGRWHERGRPIVYAAEHPAICALEVLVHLDRTMIPDDLYLCEAEFPDELVTPLDASRLPQGWTSWPPMQATRDMGTAWLTEGRTSALRVPSAAAPRSFNVLLNPAHPDLRHLNPLASEPWTPDSRLMISPQV